MANNTSQSLSSPLPRLSLHQDISGQTHFVSFSLVRVFIKKELEATRIVNDFRSSGNISAKMEQNTDLLCYEAISSHFS